MELCSDRVALVEGGATGSTGALSGVRRPVVTQLVGELMELASSPGAGLTALVGRCGLRS
ncbi:hypothetical protein [Streptomyces alkaliphilus]|nr:hypothetical protein [Streptomyces alkaliphilus]